VLAENKSRNLIVEFFGTMTLLVSIVGSGFMANLLSQNLGVALLINAAAISLTLLVLIYVLMPISGAFLNPVVVLLALVKKEIRAVFALWLIVAQILGAIMGALAANYFFTGDIWQFSNYDRISPPVFAAEIFATFGLIFLIALKDKIYDKSALVFLVPAWIFSAIFFTSSTAFANPAVSVARYFTDSFTGIALNSVPWFILAELIGFVIAFLLAKALLKK